MAGLFKDASQPFLTYSFGDKRRKPSQPLEDISPRQTTISKNSEKKLPVKKEDIVTTPPRRHSWLSEWLDPVTDMQRLFSDIYSRIGCDRAFQDHQVLITNSKGKPAQNFIEDKMHLLVGGGNLDNAARLDDYLRPSCRKSKVLSRYVYWTLYAERSLEGISRFVHNRDLPLELIGDLQLGMGISTLPQDDESILERLMVLIAANWTFYKDFLNQPQHLRLWLKILHDDEASIDDLQDLDDLMQLWEYQQYQKEREARRGAALNDSTKSGRSSYYQSSQDTNSSVPWVTKFVSEYSNDSDRLEIWSLPDSSDNSDRTDTSESSRTNHTDTSRTSTTDHVAATAQSQSDSVEAQASEGSTDVEDDPFYCLRPKIDHLEKMKMSTFELAQRQRYGDTERPGDETPWSAILADVDQSDHEESEVLEEPSLGVRIVDWAGKEPGSPERVSYPSPTTTPVERLSFDADSPDNSSQPKDLIQPQESSSFQHFSLNNGPDPELRSPSPIHHLVRNSLKSNGPFEESPEKKRPIPFLNRLPHRYRKQAGWTDIHEQFRGRTLWVTRNSTDARAKEKMIDDHLAALEAMEKEKEEEARVEAIEGPLRRRREALAKRASIAEQGVRQVHKYLRR